jgi:hypothetical protein
MFIGIFLFNGAGALIVNVLGCTGAWLSLIVDPAAMISTEAAGLPPFNLNAHAGAPEAEL